MDLLWADWIIVAIVSLVGIPAKTDKLNAFIYASCTLAMVSSSSIASTSAGYTDPSS